MKQRFSSLDVIAHELSHSLLTLRLANVYDLSSRIFLFKFAKPDNRQSLIIESGFRCHLTEYTRATAPAPSAFVARLRKFLKTRRVTSVCQVGTDRIVEVTFSDGQYRLFLEFYAGGNIILTDKELAIIALLRVVDEEHDQVRFGLNYSLESRQNYNGVPVLSPERVRSGLQSAVDREQSAVVATQNRSRKRPGDALRKAIATSLNEIPPVLIDHVLQVAKFDPNTPINNVLEDASLMDGLVMALGEAQTIINDITSASLCHGFIVAKSAKKAPTTTPDEPVLAQSNSLPKLMYDDFHPFRARQFEDVPEITILEFNGFNKAVDEFFSSIEAQKLESRLSEREESARQKLETAKLDQEKRLGGLQQVQELNVRKARAIEANFRAVQEAVAAVNGLLAQGMDWMDVARLIEMEQARNNVVANMIKLPLKLYENTATLLLAEAVYDDEDDYDGDETDSDVSDHSEDEQVIVTDPKTPLKAVEKRLAVDIDLALSPWSNARSYYDQKKSAAVKEQKTLQSSEKALKSTAKKINADLKRGLKQEKEVMRPQRKAFWFEKFLYFISSEGYLVIGGKDAPQSEILYKRYLRKGDVYVHADLSGAASIIVRNKPGMVNSPIPPSTLSQAGTLAVATSSAWDSKAVMSAWWVNAEQVSKTAPNGEYLTTGAFAVQGDKHFPPPAQLLLGFGLMFRISESSKARHLKNRFQGENNDTSTLHEESKEIEKDINEDRSPDIDQAKSNASDNEESQSTSLPEADEATRSSDDDSETSGSASETEPQNPLQPSQDRYHGSGSRNRDSSSIDLERDSEGATQTAGNSGDENPDSGAGSKSQDGNANPPNDGRKRHLSAKERRSLRKGPSHLPSDPARTAPEIKEYGGENEPSITTTLSEPSQSQVPDPKSQPNAIRGKHGKRNKLKSKYANQDEEDRAIAMRLLGSAAAQEKASQEEMKKTTQHQELAEQRERRRKQHILAAEKGKEAEEKRKLAFQEGAEQSEDGDPIEMDDLDAFVGAPLPGDEILDALVVCGPWDAMGSRCRWRVKLQPGTTKKGKAVKEILGRWSSTITDGEKKRRPGSGEGNEAMILEEEVRKREAELIRAIREPEVISIVPVGKVRLVMPGGPDGKGKGSGGGGGGKRGGRGSKRQK